MKNLELDINTNTKDGYIFDYISGIEIKATPEEVNATQEISKILVHDYLYPKEVIRTRPQFFVKRTPSEKKPSYPVDIAIFKTAEKKAEDLYIIVECKKPNEKDGVQQLQNYMTLSSAELGVWFNGKDSPVYIRKVITKDGVSFERIINIPKFGERLEDIGLYTRESLIAPHNLKTIFNSLRNHLAGNAVGTTRDEELAKQLINIVFTKIYDEKFTPPHAKVEFRAGINEPKADVVARINELFKKVKTKYKEVLDINDEISLDASSLCYIVGQLQSYCLIDAERDAIADAFEVFIGNALKGSQGQFFTPRNIVGLMIEVLDQSYEETIIDPACGSGGFIVESLRYIWAKMDDVLNNELKWPQQAINEEKTKVAMDAIYGIEKDSLLAKVAKAYMAILGDGKGGIFCEDSLEQPKNWGKKTREKVRLESFDCLLANPPFGKEIKITGSEKLGQYQLAKHWKKAKDGNTYTMTEQIKEEMPPQILFVERCLSLLNDGGRLGIIIPETYFHAPKSQYVMQFLAQHNVFCLIDLPHNTFRPHNNAKCIAVFLEKNVPQQSKILMCVAEEMGHDHQGKEIFRWDYNKHKSTDELWDDTKNIRNEIQELKSKLTQKTETNWVRQANASNLVLKGAKYTFWVDANIVEAQQVYVPRYYWQKKSEELEEQAEKSNCTLVPIAELIKQKVLSSFDGHGSPESENKGRGDIPYIRVKDIVNWEVYKDPTSKIPESTYDQIYTAKKELKEGDILYVRRGSYRIGSVAMVSPFDTKVLLTREILVMRVNPNNTYGITPYYLLYLLSHWITQEQTKNKILIETTLPNIADRWKQLALPIHQDPQKILEISNKIKRAMDSKWLAIGQIGELIEELGDLTT